MSKNNNLKDLFIKEPNVNVLLHTYRNDKTWASEIASTQNMSTRSSYQKIGELEDLNLVTKEPETNGRKPLTLTDTGQKLAQEFERLNRVFKEVNNQ